MRRASFAAIVAAAIAVGVGCSSDPTPAPRPAAGVVTTQTTAKVISFASCAEAKAAGYHDIARGAPGYSTRLDADGDGVACVT